MQPTVARAALCGLLLAVSTQAQDKPTPPRRERTVYVPIEDFDKIFDKEKGGVFVPYHELLELLKKAGTTPPTVTPPPVTPPAEWVLVGAQLKGTAGERVVQFEATFDVEVLEKENWVVVPIGLGEAALEDVRTGPGQRAVVGPLAALLQQRGKAPQGSGYGIVVKGAGRIQTTARFAVPIASKPGESSFGLTLPGAALTNFEVTLPQSGLRVKVDNALATEEKSIAAQDQTNVRAYFGAASRATVTWNPRPKTIEGEKRDPLLFADTETSMFLDEGVLQSTTRIRYRILQAPCGEFKVQFPKGYTLLSVAGQNMSADPVPEESGENQTITVRLHDKVADAYELALRLERILGEGAQDLAFPRVVALGAERESGMLAARSSRFLTLEPAQLKGVSQIDAAGINASLAQDLKYNRGEERPPLVFRYLRQPWSIQLKSAQIEPEVDGRVMTLAVVRDDEVGLSTTIHYAVRKRGIFGVRVKVPAGFQLLRCEPDQVIKDSRVEKTDKGDVLVVDFNGQVQPTPQFSLMVLGRIMRAPSETSLELPRFGLLDVKKETGLLAVGASKHLQLNLKKDSLSGLNPEAVADLQAQGFPYGVRPQDEDMVFGYRYIKPEGVKASFELKKREPKVTARAEVLCDAQEDLVRVETRMIYTIEYAGIEQVTLRVPKALESEEQLKIEGEGVKEKQSGPDPKSAEHALWTVSLQGKRLGEVAITLRYDIKLDDLAAGQRRDVKLHEIQAVGVFTETGDVALKKHENLVINPVPTMMERRDKRELPEALRRHGPIQAYRYVSHPHELQLQLTKYDFKAPLGILINHLHLIEVIEEDGKIQVEAWLSLQNNAEQFLKVGLPESAEFVGLKLGGKSKPWSQGKKGEGKQEILIHLGEITKEVAERAFQVRLRYDLPSAGALSGSGTLELGVPSFPLALAEQQVPVGRLTREVYLPTDLAYLEYDTDATKHFEETSMWERLKLLLGVRTGKEWLDPQQGARAAEAAIARLRSMAADESDADSSYRPLQLKKQTSLLFEKLDSPTRLSVRYMSWPLFYLGDVLVLVAVVVLGVFLESRRAVRAIAYVPVAAALMVLGATFGGKALEPFCASGFVGALGLGAFFLGRGAWRELTVLRHERRLAELAQEAQVAKARAAAAEAEARLRSGAPVAAAAATRPAPIDPKAGPSSGDQASADRIEYQGPKS